MSAEICSDKRSCSQCARAVESPSSSLAVDEHHIICDECYRKMLVPDHRSVQMELFDASFRLHP